MADGAAKSTAQRLRRKEKCKKTRTRTKVYNQTEKPKPRLGVTTIAAIISTVSRWCAVTHSLTRTYMRDNAAYECQLHGGRPYPLAGNRRYQRVNLRATLCAIFVSAWAQLNLKPSQSPPN